MPITHRYDDATRTVFVTAEGTVTGDELLAFARQLAPDASVPSGRRELWDLTRLEKAEVSGPMLRQVAEIFRPHDTTRFESQIAIAAPSDVAFGLARMYQAFRGDAPIALQVFRDLGEARRWLGLED